MRWLTIFDWITLALAIWHLFRRLPDDIRRILHGKPLSEHSVFVRNRDYNYVKSTLGSLSTGPDVYDLFSDKWTMIISTDDLEEAQNRLGMAGVRYRS